MEFRNGSILEIISNSNSVRGKKSKRDNLRPKRVIDSFTGKLLFIKL